nr:Chain A, U11-myrmicitoxin-Tb1a [Tetramorium bicarinatum]
GKEKEKLKQCFKDMTLAAIDYAKHKVEKHLFKCI